MIQILIIFKTKNKNYKKIKNILILKIQVKKDKE